MFAISLGVGILLGYLCRGRLSNMAYVKLVAPYLIFIGFGVELLVNQAIKQQWLTLGGISCMLDFLMHCIILYFIWLNRQYLAIKWIGIGFFLNGLVIFANGGAMPIGNWALSQMGVSEIGNMGLYTMMHEGTKLVILADIIPIVFSSVGFAISIGDIAICIGMILFIVQAMRLEEPLVI